mmetsp:Transcript_4062/g.7057  ORF Transcript_4062/g.7057 Transcript_4062/m.7057 type:complete len:346 (-) Transcript_4062:53-1090(-)
MKRKMTKGTIEQACERIVSSQFLVISAGAGFGADSGLPIYANIDDKLPVPYDHLCNPKCAETDPIVFGGFWGQCWESFTKTKPHDGYKILKRWVAQYYSSGEIHERVSSMLRGGKSNTKNNKKKKVTDESERRVVFPGACMVYTTNIDGHFLEEFPEHMVYEKHGTVRYWQCSKAPAAKELNPSEVKQKRSTLKRLDPSFSFSVDLKTLHTSTPLPECTCCNKPMRPNVLMFNDKSWAPRNDAEQTWDAWRELAIEVTLEKSSHHLTILELGAGTKVPTLRREMEYMIETLEETGQVTLIRINPDQDEKASEDQPCTIQIFDTALHALTQMDEKIRLRPTMKQDH